MSEKGKLTAYISGPITGRDKAEYMDHFKRAELALKGAGWEVINPAEANEKLADILDYDTLMKVCRAEVEESDAIYLLKGWEKSRGAKIELYKAIWEKKEIFLEP